MCKPSENSIKGVLPTTFSLAVEKKIKRNLQLPKSKSLITLKFIFKNTGKRSLRYWIMVILKCLVSYISYFFIIMILNNPRVSKLALINKEPVKKKLSRTD